MAASANLSALTDDVGDATPRPRRHRHAHCIAGTRASARIPTNRKSLEVAQISYSSYNASHGGRHGRHSGQSLRDLGVVEHGFCSFLFVDHAGRCKTLRSSPVSASMLSVG